MKCLAHLPRNNADNNLFIIYIYKYYSRSFLENIPVLVIDVGVLLPLGMSCVNTLANVGFCAIDNASDNEKQHFIMDNVNKYNTMQTSPHNLRIMWHVANEELDG